MWQTRVDVVDESQCGRRESMWQTAVDVEDGSRGGRREWMPEKSNIRWLG
jgi:hypothetical protein